MGQSIEEFSQKEILVKIYKRVGWVLFWVIFLGIAILSGIDGL